MTPDDLQQVWSHKRVASFLQAGLTLPDLFAASTNINTVQDYERVFQRLYDELGIGSKVSATLNGASDEEAGYAALEELYAERHRIVHEIGYEKVGHWNLRHDRQLSFAEQMGVLVRNCVVGIERHVANAAPPDFPNLLGPDGGWVDPRARVAQMICQSELRIKELMQGDELAQFAPKVLEAVASTHSGELRVRGGVGPDKTCRG